MSNEVNPSKRGALTPGKEDPLRATKIIDDFDLDKVNLWFRELKTIISSKKPTLLQKYPDQLGGDLYTTGDNNNGYYYLMVDDEIVYFVRYRKIKANGNSFGRQVLVARRKDSLEASKVAAHVFFSYLLPRFGALMSDTQQTRHGKAFWTFVLSEAFMKNLHVYCLDRRSTPNTLQLISDRRVLQKDYASIIWGTDEGHLRTHAVISKTLLSIK